MKVVENANLALRFLLELSALAAVGYWGWRAGEGALRWVLATAAVAGVVVVWALFVSEKATVELARPLQFAIELGVWTAAGAALYATGHTQLGVALVAVAVFSGSLNYAWD